MAFAAVINQLKPQVSPIGEKRSSQTCCLSASESLLAQDWKISVSFLPPQHSDNSGHGEHPHFPLRGQLNDFIYLAVIHNHMFA